MRWKPDCTQVKLLLLAVRLLWMIQRQLNCRQMLRLCKTHLTYSVWDEMRDVRLCTRLFFVTIGNDMRILRLKLSDNEIDSCFFRISRRLSLWSCTCTFTLPLHLKTWIIHVTYETNWLQHDVLSFDAEKSRYWLIARCEAFFAKTIDLGLNLEYCWFQWIRI